MSEALRRAMDEVEQTRREQARLTREHPEQWKADFGRLRPVLDGKIDALSREGEAWFRGHGDAARRDEFEGLVKAAKRALSGHQARWPVLIITRDSPEYLASVQAVEASFAELAGFINRLPR